MKRRSGIYFLGLMKIITFFVLNLFVTSVFSQSYTDMGYIQNTGINDISGGSTSVPTFADIDKDGDLDLYLGENLGKINTYLNDGAGNFTSAGRLQIEGIDINVGQASAPVFADIDNDNDLDLYVGDVEGFINIFLNDGNGNFTSAGYLEADASIIDVGNQSVMTYADIDNDLDLDLYVGEWSGIIIVFTNDGTGNFTASGNLQADGSDISIGLRATPTFADIDNDNDLDLYVGEYNGNINVFTNDGAGNFTASGNLQAYGSDINVGGQSVPTFADIDEDNDLDLYIGEMDGSVNVYYNDGTGNFVSPAKLQSQNSFIDIGSQPGLVFADIDKDNDMDLYSGMDNGRIVYYLNDGSGNFSLAGNLQADGVNIDADSYSVPVFCDLDNDGDMDLYVGEYNGNVLVFTNDGTGNFSYSGFLQADGVDLDVGKHSSPTFADLDNDNDFDLYVGEWQGSVSVYINDGNAVFSNAGLLQADGSNIDVSYPRLHFTDADADNDLDLYIGERNGNVHVFTNDGSANFSVSGLLQADDFDIDIGFNASPYTVNLNNDCLPNLYIGCLDGRFAIYKANDNIDPTITSSHDDLILSDEGNCAATLPDYTGTIIAVDNCDISLDISQDPPAGTSITGSSNPVTLTVTDDLGNFDELTFNAAVEDHTDPVISSTHTDITVDADENCEFILADYTSTVSSTDNCDINLIIGQNPVPGSAISGTVNQITLTVTDGSGNFTEASFNVALEDNSNPVITSTHNDQTIDADENCEASLPDYTTGVTANDNCDSNLDISQIPSAGTTVSGISNQVSLSVTDDAGNFEQVLFNIEVIDNSDPIITSIHSDQSLDADANCEAILPDYTTDVTAHDNCDAILDISQSPSAGTIVSGITNQIILSVTDDAGNFSQILFNVEVLDITDPVITSTHTDQTIDADENCEATLPDYTINVTASDNCDTNLDISQIPSAGTIVSGISNQVNLRVTDDAGNFSQVIFNIDVIDNSVPVPDVTSLDDMTGECTVNITSVPTATDNCAGSINGTTNDPLSYNEQGTYSILWTYSDGNNNTSNQTQTVIVDDVSAPVPIVAILEDIVGECSVTVSEIPEATDNCEGIVYGTTNDPLIYDELGTYTITWTFDDGNGNTSSQSQTVVVDDITIPEIECPEDQIVELNEGESYYTVSGAEFDPVSTNDNCSVANILNDFNSSSTLDGTVLPLGTTSIEWFIEDEAGNTNSCNFEVLVEAYEDIAEQKKLGIIIYPNPSEGVFHIETEDTYVISVSHITGKKLIEIELLKGKTEIDLSNYSSGIYFIEFRNTRFLYVAKVIKK